MKFSLLIHTFIILLSTQMLYTMQNNLEDAKVRVAHCSNNLENAQQILNNDQQTINVLRDMIFSLNRINIEQAQNHKISEKKWVDACGVYYHAQMLKWIAGGSGIGLILIGCIVYLFWENRALKKELVAKDAPSSVILK